MLLLALVQQYSATHCNTLQHTATHCNTLQYTAIHCSTLQHTAAHCSTMQHTATHQSVQLFKSLLAIECAVERDYTVCCSVLQYVAVCCIESLLAIGCAVDGDYTMCCSVLQYVAVCCIKMHHATSYMLGGTCKGALCSSQKRLIFFTTETLFYTKETHILYKRDQYFKLYSKCIMPHSTCNSLLVIRAAKTLRKP